MSFMKRAAALAAAAITAFAASASAHAEAPYNSYNDRGDPVLSQNGFEIDGVFYGADIGCGELTAPCDMFFTENETLLIADSGYASANGSGRIVAVNSELELISSVEQLDFSDMREWLGGKALALENNEISEESYNKETSAYFNTPTGIFADNDLVYVADSGNERVVAYENGSNGIGRVKRVFTLDENEAFSPLKLVADPIGNVYVRVKGQDGAAVFTRGGEFKGYFGNGDFSNLDIDKEGYIFASTNNAGSLMKLDPDGRDVFGDTGSSFGYTYSLDYHGKTYAAASADIDISENGDILLLDRGTGCLFLYNSECVPLFTFGGAGDRKGTFENPTAAETLNGRVYVLDSAKNSVTVFRPTEFGEIIFDAEALLNSGEWESSIEMWQRAIGRDPSCAAAHIGIGRACLGSGNAEKAMEHLKGFSTSLYSEAFRQRRRELLRGHFTLISVTVPAAAAAVFVISAIRRRKHAKPLAEKSRTLRIMRHPVEGFFELRMENAYHLPTALIILALFFVVTAVSEDLMGAVRNILLFLIWVTANKAVCALFGGNGSLKAVSVSSAYALCPLIVGKLVNMLLSNLLAPDERAPLVIVSAASAVYGFIMLFSGMRETHRYSFGKTAFSMLLSVLGTGAVIVLITLIITLLARVWLFFRSIFTEILYRVPSITAPVLAFIFIGAAAVIVGAVCGAYMLYEKLRRNKPRGE